MKTRTDASAHARPPRPRPRFEAERRFNGALATLAFFVVIAFTAILHGDVISGPIFNAVNDHYYYLLSEDTWTNSQAEAIAMGGNLVTIDNAAENKWVYDTFASFGGINRNLWIGYYDAAATGTYSWVSGATSTYSN